MVEMIPENLISDEVKSEAERDLFYQFRDETTDEKFVVLHSLALPEHKVKKIGEIDFVIISRDGITCVEVKGGIVKREHGKWSFTNRYGHTNIKTESPFRQASGNMCSLNECLRKRLKKDDPIINCTYACCVMMPNCVFKDDSPEVIPEICFDQRSDISLKKIVETSMNYWKSRNIHHIIRDELDDDDIKRAAGVLRGDFCCTTILKSHLDQIDKKISTFTKEQFDIFDQISDNSRMMISGPAGSGKTILAMEFAERSFYEGKNVLYLCYNRSIAQYVKDCFAIKKIDVTVKTFHAYLEDLCGLEDKSDDSSHYFNQVLPEIFLNLKSHFEYDLLIVDEGQDLLTPININCFDKMIKSGIQNGAWAIFYDLNQNIFNENDMFEGCFSKISKYAMKFRLTKNCRNTKEIINTNINISNVTTQGTPLVEGGVDSINKTYSSSLDEFNQVVEALFDLQNRSVSASDIVLLSKYSLDNPKNCLYGQDLKCLPWPIKSSMPLWRSRKDEIRFSTIHSFKGLDAKVVFLMDVDDFKSPQARSLNYVGISRAEAMLYLFYDEKKNNEREQMLLESFKK